MDGGRLARSEAVSKSAKGQIGAVDGGEGERGHEEAGGEGLAELPEESGDGEKEQERPEGEERVGAGVVVVGVSSEEEHGGG